MNNWYKRWLLSRPYVIQAFADLAERVIKQTRIDTFGDAQKDILDTMADDLDKKVEELSKEKLSKLLSVVDERMVISFNEREKAVYIGGQKITDPARLQNMKSEAEAIEQMDIWRVMHETPKRLAQKALFEDDGDSKAVHTKGRAVLYTLDTQQRILSTLKSYSTKSTG